nr:DNA-entry nuclease [Anoxybacillus rupiensis]
MKYHPELHPNHGKPFTESDLEYLCKFYEFDGAESISLALGKTEHTILTKVYDLRKRGLFEYYKNLNKHWV